MFRIFIAGHLSIKILEIHYVINLLAIHFSLLKQMLVINVYDSDYQQFIRNIWSPIACIGILEQRVDNIANLKGIPTVQTQQPK